MTLEEDPGAPNPISSLGASHQHLGEGGGLSAEPSPRNTVNVLPSICLIFFAFKLFCIVTLE